jgi:hypothetical protein
MLHAGIGGVGFTRRIQRVEPAKVNFAALNFVFPSMKSDAGREAKRTFPASRRSGPTSPRILLSRDTSDIDPTVVATITAYMIDVAWRIVHRHHLVDDPMG